MIQFGWSEPYGTVPPVSSQLTPTSYLVLGLLATRGPATSYELKRRVAQSVGYFWSFPHSQLYAEPPRLAAAGMVEDEREERGRRRRTFRITPSGREALRRWLAAPVESLPEIRDLGLLKLFFAELTPAEDVAALAAASAAAHARRLAEYESIERLLGDNPARRYPRLALQLGIAHERAAVDFWRSVADRPSGRA